MAKYDVTATCGHMHTVRLFGPHADRERRLAWYRSRLCEECSEVARQHQITVRNTVAQEVSVTLGLPLLVGSERQIPWATTIRKDVIDSVCAVLRPLALKHFPSDVNLVAAESLHILADRIQDTGKEGSERLAVGLRELWETVHRETSAHWWIDNREKDAREWLR